MAEERSFKRTPGKFKTFFKKKTCRFCEDKKVVIDYKRPEILRSFITERGKILPRRMTGVCSHHQHELSLAIKRARMMALLPFAVHE
jgi:small subunit ribosomal protein S18